MALVGEITWQQTLLPSHLKLDGQQVVASNYSDLVTFVTTNHLNGTTQEYAENKALYVYDQTNDRLTLPDFTDKTIWGVASESEEIEAGLPNVRGSIGAIPQEQLTLPQNWQNTATFAVVPADGVATGSLMFDASSNNPIYGNSTTVQPPAIGLIPQVAYAVTTAASGSGSGDSYFELDSNGDIMPVAASA